MKRSAAKWLPMAGLALLLVAEGGFAAVQKLPEDYYAKSSGLVAPDLLEEILAKESLDKADADLLSRLAEGSAADRVRVRDRSTIAFQERGDESGSAELLTKLNRNLAEERGRLFSDIVEHIKRSKLDAGRVCVLVKMAMNASREEFLALMDAVPILLQDSQMDSYASGHTLIHFAVYRGVCADSRQAAWYRQSVALLEKRVEEIEERRKSSGCGSDFDGAKPSLVMMGSETGRRLTREAIAKALDPKADYSSLVSSIPKALSFTIMSPDLPDTDAVIGIGRNARRVNRERLGKA